MPGERARTALAGTRFADVRWVAETGSTNADAMELARQGAPEGVVLVADHQTAGRGRQGRTWAAPPGASLLVSVLLRPPVAVAPATTMAVGVAMADAVEAAAGFAPRLKWPNDLVWPPDDRKLAGILAEADWTRPQDPVVTVVGIGVNVNWPEELPPELAALAVAINHITGETVDREDLLIEFLHRLDERYGALVTGGEVGLGELSDAWRARSATLGRRVRVDLGTRDIVGRAVDITADGRLVVETDDGERATVTAGDVVHLRAV